MLEQYSMDWSANGGELKRKHDEVQETEDSGSDNKKKNVISPKISFDKEGYSADCKGPYQVWVKNLVSSAKSFNIYKVGKIVVKYFKSVQEVKKDGRFKGILIFENREEANSALESTIFKDNDLYSFIPGFKKVKKGVMRDIPVDISNEELKSEIVSSMEVLDVVRMNKKNPDSKNDNDKWIPTTSILVTFKGDRLPKEVTICLVKTKVDPYVRSPMQCYNCFMFGHMAKTCRNVKKCSMCGESHDESCEIDTPRCANCKGDHKSISSKCPVFEKNKLLCERMAYDNLSYAEARALIFGVPKAPRLNKIDFPSLKENLKGLDYNKTNKIQEHFLTSMNDKEKIPLKTRTYSRINASDFFGVTKSQYTTDQTTTDNEDNSHVHHISTMRISQQYQPPTPTSKQQSHIKDSTLPYLSQNSQQQQQQSSQSQHTPSQPHPQLQRQYDIILLEETWLNSDSGLLKESHFNLKGFETVRFDRDFDKGGGLAICVKNGIPFERTELNFTGNSVEVGAVYIESSMGKILITLCYRSPKANNNISKVEWCKLLDAIKQKGIKHYIVAGDFNAHHALWGSSKQCCNGNVIADNLDYENFILLNDKVPTYVKMSNSGINYSNIDLTFVSPGLALVSDWEVLEDRWGSDHFPILIEINAEPNFKKKVRYRYNLSKVSWEKFYGFLEDNKSYFNSIEFINLDVISRYNKFVDFIDNAITEAYSKDNDYLANRDIECIKDGIHKKPKCIWWNEECTKAVRLRKAAQLSIKHQFTIERFIEVKRTEALVRKTLKEEKSKSIRNFCESVNPRTNISVFWEKIKRFKNGINKNQNTTGNMKQEINIKNTIESLCSPKMNIGRHLSDINSMEENENDSWLDAPFSMEELDYCLNNVNVSSSPGVDKIDYQIIVNLPEFYHSILLDLYNDIFHSKVFPEDWKTYLVKFIPKGNSDKVRPISLASCLLKVMERLVKERLEWWCETKGLLAVSQMGFRKGKSCVDNLSILTTAIQRNFFQKEAVAALFLDVKGAYNDVIPEILIDDLVKLGIPKKVVCFISHLILERKVLFCTNSEIITKTINKGLPQGSVLSPLLYSIYTRILEKVIDGSCNVLQFADDVSVYNKEVGIDVEEKVHKLEINVSNIIVFLRERGLEIAPEKCVFVIFYDSKYNPYKDLKININNVLVENSENVKFLGMYLDRRLDWKKHIEYVVNKCLSAMKIISCLRRTWWGADPSSLLHLYIALIRSRIEYGGFLISPCSASNFDKLQRIQNIAIRTSLGYRMSTPINVMTAESKIPYLNIRMKELCNRYILKCLSIKNNLVITNLENLSDVSESNIHKHNFKKALITECYDNLRYLEFSIISSEYHMKYVGKFNSSFYTPDIDLIKGKKISKDKFPNDKFDLLFPKKPNAIHIYTDGSKQKIGDSNSVGFATWSNEETFTCAYRILDKASIFTAECKAIIEVSNRITAEIDKECIIFSDSKSALQALEHKGKNGSSPLIDDLRQKLSDLAVKGIKVKLVWIPAHVGIIGNEIVDMKAKEAAIEGELLNQPIPYTDFFANVKEICRQENRSIIGNLGKKKGMFYFENFYDEKSNKPWFNNIHSLSRKALVSINRIRSNHTSLNSSLFRHKIIDTDECKCEEGIDTIEHIFWNCKLYNEQREILFKELRKTYKIGPFSVINLLSLNDTNIFHTIGEFINNIDCNI